MVDFVQTHFDPIMRWGGCFAMIVFLLVMNAWSASYVTRKFEEQFEPMTDAEYRRAFGLPPKKPSLRVIEGDKE